MLSQEDFSAAIKAATSSCGAAGITTARCKSIIKLNGEPKAKAKGGAKAKAKAAAAAIANE